jgi:outer membrane lipoprotein SlyB
MENKKINSKMIVIVMLLAVFLNLANGQEINFDFDMKNKLENNFFELKSDIKPVIPEVSSATVISSKRIKEVNNSILNSIRYCEKNDISPTITDGLKKLLVYGNNEEKLSFLNSKDKFVIPQRLSSFETPDISNFLGISKGQIQICEQKNCRYEKVCGWKKVCEDLKEVVCHIVGAGGAAAGAAAGNAVGGPAGAGAGGYIGGVAGYQVCETITKNVCKDVEDCQTVQKCDTVCHWEDVGNIQPGQCVTNSDGQTVFQ